MKTKVPFQKVEVNGESYWKEVSVQNPDIQLCHIAGITKKSENSNVENLLDDWRSENEDD